MPNTTLALRRRVESAGRDPHGEPLPGRTVGYSAPSASLPAYAREEADGSWLLCLDDALWPVRQGDLVVGGGGQWLINTSHRAQNSLDHSVDYVRCTGAQQVAAGTEPGGAQFVGR